MKRLTFSKECKSGAVRAIQGCGVAVGQASRNLELAERVLRRWVREALRDKKTQPCIRGRKKRKTPVKHV